jgi:hypothetical protein
VPGTQLSGAGAFEGAVRQVPVNGVRIGYRQFGSGPDLILVTGDTAAMSLWTVDLLSELARHFRVTIFDNRGVASTRGRGWFTGPVPVDVPIFSCIRNQTLILTNLGTNGPTSLGTAGRDLVACRASVPHERQRLSPRGRLMNTGSKMLGPQGDLREMVLVPQPGPDTDPNEPDRLGRQLPAQLNELHVESAAARDRNRVPPGAKGAPRKFTSHRPSGNRQTGVQPTDSFLIELVKRGGVLMVTPNGSQAAAVIRHG